MLVIHLQIFADIVAAEMSSQWFSVLVLLPYFLSTTELQVDTVSQKYNESCPPWLNHGNGSCQCIDHRGHEKICQDRDVSVPCGTCLTWDSTINKAVITECPYVSKNTTEVCQDLRYQIPASVPSSDLNNIVCSQFYRQGTHCKECKENYGPAPFLNGANIPCAKCHAHDHTWVLHLLLQLLMVTLLYFGFVFCECKGTSSPLSVLAYFYQVIINAITSNSFLYTQILCNLRSALMQILFTLFAFWNLDFFRYSLPPVCVSPSMTNAQVLLFEYFIAFFPVFLTSLSYALIKLHSSGCYFVVLLWKPFNSLVSRYKKDWNPLQSILSTFATFLLLSYSKILFTSANLLYGVPVYDNDGKVVQGSPILYYDTSLEYFGRGHIPYVCLALTVTLLFVILPPVILILYPTKCFKRCLERVGFGHWNSLSIFMDVFQGWYKDGTNGTSDFRAMSALYMVLRSCFAIEFTLNLMFQFDTTVNSFQWTLPSVIHIGMGCFYLTVKPYKKSWMNTVDGLTLIALGIAIVLVIVSDDYSFCLSCVIVASPMIVALTYVLGKCFQKARTLSCFQFMLRRVQIFASRFADSHSHIDFAGDSIMHARLTESGHTYSPLQSSHSFHSHRINTGTTQERYSANSYGSLK